MPVDIKFKDAILPLRRPEYIALPEALISSLAWQLLPEARRKDDSARIGRIFRLVGEPSKSKLIDFVKAVHPDKKNDTFGTSLKTNGIRPDSVDSSNLAEGVLTSLSGIRAPKSRTQAASPLTPHLALLQNTRGVTAKLNPPDVAAYLQQLYDLRSERACATNKPVAVSWYDATMLRMTNDPMLRAIDDSVRASLLPELPEVLDFVPSGADSERPLILRDVLSTPFTWFAESWTTLTSQEWVEALPPRVWVDWALTILRLSVGMGFLWESNWYIRLGESILNLAASSDKNSPSPKEIADRVDDLLPWRQRRTSVSIRDVNAPLRLSIFRGQAIREILDSTRASDAELAELSFSTGLRELSEDSSACDQIQTALNSRTVSAKTVWETVRYNLLTRESSGPNPDYYGLLKMNGRRYLVIEPGTEWIAVVASLACGRPGGEANVGDLLDSLDALGLHPEMGDLVDLLERAGLARGSADADQGVRIKSAY